MNSDAFDKIEHSRAMSGVVAVSPQLRPEDFKDKMDAPHADFYRCWGAQLGSPLARVTEQISASLIMRFGITTLAQQFSLTCNQFEQDVLLHAGLPGCAAAAAGWRMTVERMLERNFMVPNAKEPSAAQRTNHPKDLQISCFWCMPWEAFLQILKRMFSMTNYKSAPESVGNMWSLKAARAFRGDHHQWFEDVLIFSAAASYRSFSPRRAI